MPQLISARLPDPTAERVKQYARRKQRSVNETVSIALEEWLRLNEFALIEFRDTRDGRQAFMKNSRLPVYWIIKTAQEYGMDLEKLQTHWPNQTKAWINAALNYYEAYPQEIDDQIAEYRLSSSRDVLMRRFPQMEIFEAPSDTVQGE